MAAIDDLKAIRAAKAATLSDSEDKAEALMYLDDWYNAKAAHAALSSGQISSYSIQGRSVTRRNASDLIAISDAALKRFNALLYGAYSIADMSQVGETSNGNF
jgi:hypothetical protein